MMAKIGTVMASIHRLGGWTLTPHHYYDRSGGVLFLGDGSRRDAEPVGTPACVFDEVGEDPDSTNLVSVVADDGSELYVFNADGLHLLTLDTMAGHTNFSFGYIDDLLVAITDRHGNVTTIERDGLGDPVAIVSPFGLRTELIVNPSGYLEKLINPAHETNVFHYTSGGLLTNIVTRRGLNFIVTYCTTGLVRRVDFPDGFSWAFSRSEHYVSNRYEFVVGEVYTNVYGYEYLEGGLIRRTATGPNGYADGKQVTSSDDTETTETLSDGTVIVTRRAPDQRFKMHVPQTEKVTLRVPSGLTMTATVARALTLADTNNLLDVQSFTNHISINNRTFVSEFDAATRRWTSQSPEGRTAAVEFDEALQPVIVERPGLHALHIAYDQQGRAEEVARGTGPEERRIRLSYNEDGYLHSLSNALGQEVLLLPDKIGRVTNIVRPDQERIAVRYNASLPVGVTPPDRPEHELGYNDGGLFDRYTAPDIGGPTNLLLHWNTARELTGVTWPDGRSITNLYDTSGLLVQSKWPENKVIITNDPSSRRPLSITATNQTSLGLVWDGLLLAQVKAGGVVTGQVDFAYNHDFRVSGIGFNGTLESYGYDQDGLMTNAGAMALLRHVENGFLTNATLGLVQDHRHFNGFGEWTHYRAAYDATDLYGVDFQYDALGRITSRVERIGGATNTFSYTYDLAGCLVQVETNGSLHAQYEYDANGNRTNAWVVGVSRAGTYDDQDRLLLYGTTAYQYNDHGTLTNKIEGTNSTAYVYDTRSSLLEVRAGTDLIQYTVDPLGRRIARKKNSVTTQRLVYQGFLQPVAALNADGSVDTRFIYATRVNVPDYMVRSGVTYRIVTDHLGSVRLVVNVDTGTIAQKMDYDEWGRVLQDTNPGFQPFGFAGGLYDPDTGLVRFGYRDYDAATGRWLAKDPILFGGGSPNLYTYCQNDPINWVDPMGLAELYDNPWDAVQAGLLSAFLLSKGTGWEYGGWIYRQGNKFGYSGPGTSKHRRELFIRDIPRIPSGANVVGMFHSHPGVWINGEYVRDTSIAGGLSGPDMDEVNDRGIPGYIVDGDGTIYGYRFGHPKYGHRHGVPMGKVE